MTARRPIALKDLIADSRLAQADIAGNPRTMVTGISINAQKTGRNEMFVAINGTRIDSHALIPQAIEAGASVVVVEREIEVPPGVSVVRVDSTRAALGPLAHAMHRHPARAINVCGITGTNGKTTSTHLVYSILEHAKRRPGLIGTLGARHGAAYIPLNTTTPGPLELAEIFRQFEEDQVDCVAMECSSHAIDQARIGGIPFRVGALTNITQDHLDYHGTFENYVACKASFFHEQVCATPGSVACFNLDDPAVAGVSSVYTGAQLTYARDNATADVEAADVFLHPTGITMRLRIEDVVLPVSARLAGEFNVYNILTAASCCYAMGVSPEEIAAGIEAAPPVSGRFEYVDEGQPFTVLVDYAHTPDALLRVMRTARRICAGRLIVTFGAGGDRDRGKRPIMGRYAGEHADYVIITSDNPRTEDPALIARQVLEGVLQSPLRSNCYQVVLDRRGAIEKALTMASPNDVVVIAGKGHEDYQEIGHERHPFDDRLVARKVLRSIASAYRQHQSLEIVSELGS